MLYKIYDKRWTLEKFIYDSLSLADPGGGAPGARPP